DKATLSPRDERVPTGDEPVGINVGQVDVWFDAFRGRRSPDQRDILVDPKLGCAAVAGFHDELRACRSGNEAPSDVRVKVGQTFRKLVTADLANRVSRFVAREAALTETRAAGFAGKRRATRSRILCFCAPTLQGLAHAAIPPRCRLFI